MNRRMFFAVTTGLAVQSRRLHGQDAVPNSAGTQPPRLNAPANAADCHMHIYDPARFPMSPTAAASPRDAAVPQYRLLQRRIGTTRVVIVTPRNYVTDNSATLDAIAQLSPNARGVAVVHPTVTNAELKHLDGGGVRGIRFSLSDPKVAVTTWDMVEPLAKRVADLGWHVQLGVVGEQVVEHATLLQRLPSELVFDHLGRPPLPAGITHPSHRIIRDLVDRGRAWVKVSGAYLNSTAGPPYAEATNVAQAFINASPERMVWGSDWPHPTAPTGLPDDALLFDLLTKWAPSESIRHRILVENPEILYGFRRT